MGKRRLLPLCVCTLVVYAGIGGLVGLMPVYLTRLGANAAITGALLASAYLALAVSNIGAGRLAERGQRRRAYLIVGGALAAPVAWLMGRATTVEQIWVLLAGLWFLLGLPMTMANILTGLLADAAYRGRSFGVLTLSSGCGLFLGGLVSGPIVDCWGFPSLFAAFAASFLLIPLVGRFAENRIVPAVQWRPGPTLSGLLSRRTFALLLAANTWAQAANVVIFLSRPLIMEARHFDVTAISTATAGGSVATLPLPLVVGWLADRVGRKVLLVACFLAPPLGLLVQAVAVRPWHFGIGSMLSTVVGVGLVVESAVIADLFPETSRGTALALLHATTWAGIVLGQGAGGVTIRTLQMVPTLLLAALSAFWRCCCSCPCRSTRRRGGQPRVVAAILFPRA